MNPDPCPLDAYEAGDLDVSFTATLQFRTAHPGHTRLQAEVSLRSLVEDLAVQRRWSQDGRGYLELARMGYFVAISPDLTTVVTYKTAHTERTWSQVKAGVPSRGAAERGRRRRSRVLDRRSRALEKAGVTFQRVPGDAESSGWVTVFTRFDGRTLAHAGPTLDRMALYRWEELVTRLREEWGVIVEEEEHGAPSITGPEHRSQALSRRTVEN